MITRARILLLDSGRYEALVNIKDKGSRLIEADTIEMLLKEIGNCQVQEQK